jgi:DNA-binding NtrC family response regulator/pSer/pThr/pTyr-binding forkhead associated (FHA) protein
MVTLAIEGNGGSELTYQLVKQVISVGASSQNDVVLRSPGVAPRHLVIQRNDKVFTFLAQPRQVVVLNGERRSRGVLRVGDRIRIGTATLIFKGFGEEEQEIELVSDELREEAVAAAGARPAEPARAPRARSEVVLYSEPNRLAEARQHMVEIFRAGVRSDLVPSLRTFLGNFFNDRQAMLAWLDENGRFQPIVSQWTGEVPRLPARTFDELGTSGRYAVLRMASRQAALIYPVSRGALDSQAYLIVESLDEDIENDQVLLAELARMLAVHWERVENSSSLYGAWEDATRKTVEDHLPGTSPAVRVLRESVIQAARSTFPVLLCGRPGSGRTAVATLIASIHPTGELPVQAIQVKEGEDDAFRLDLFGPPSEHGARASLAERAKGSLIVIRDIHLLAPGTQRELAASMSHDVESGYGPAVRWVATTEPDCMALVNDGVLDSTLYNLFQRHIMRIPALNQRREDLPLLVVRLLDAVGAEQDKEIRGIELETLTSLLNHPFEGEMSELLGELRRLVSATPEGEMVRGTVPATFAARLEPGAPVPDEPSIAALVLQDDLKVVVPEVERMIIDRVLRRTLGNQSKAARMLNLSRGALIAKIKDYGLADYRHLRRSR